MLRPASVWSWPVGLGVERGRTMNANGFYPSEQVTLSGPSHGAGRPIARRALARAFARFMARYRTWAEALFDLHFLTHRGAPILARYAQTGRGTAARELADAWAEQFGPGLRGERRVRRVQQLTPVAAHFLHMLDAAQKVDP